MVREDGIGESERWASALLGGMLVLSSLRRHDVTAGAMFALGGAALLYRGFAGRDGFFGAAGRWVQEASSPTRGDRVDEASKESFPASDAPSWTPTTSLGSDESD